VMLRPNPIEGRTLDHPAFEPWWSLFEELGVPALIHEGTSQNYDQAGRDRYDNYLYAHMCSHSFEQQMALMCLICGGALERHPNFARQCRWQDAHGRRTDSASFPRTARKG